MSDVVVFVIVMGAFGFAVTIGFYLAFIELISLSDDEDED